MKRLVLLLLILNVFITGIVFYSVYSNPVLESVSLNCVSCEYFVNEIFELSARGEPKQAPVVLEDWKSSNEQVAKVNQDGTVSTVGVGECVISVFRSDKKYGCKGTAFF